MERLQSHLGSRLSDRLGTDGADGRSCGQDKRPGRRYMRLKSQTWLNLRLGVFCPASIEEG